MREYRSWIAVKTSGTKEKHVENELFLQGYECYIPMAVKDVAVSRHTKARKLVRWVLIPRVVFVRAPDDLDLFRVQHAKGIARNVDGAVLRIPDSQMARFAETHCRWLETQTKHYQAWLRSLEKKGKKPQVIKPSIEGWMQAMERVGNMLFGQKEAA